MRSTAIAVTFTGCACGLGGMAVRQGRILAFVLLTLLAACRPHPLSVRLDRACSRREHVDRLIVDWGSAAAVDRLSDGRLVYTWKRPWTSSAVNYAAAYGQAYAVQHVCTIVVQTSADGIIEHYRYYDC
jgi:hypothetical protein